MSLEYLTMCMDDINNKQCIVDDYVRIHYNDEIIEGIIQSFGPHTITLENEKTVETIRTDSIVKLEKLQKPNKTENAKTYMCNDCEVNFKVFLKYGEIIKFCPYCASYNISCCKN